MKLLEFLLRNSYFTYEQEHYQQTFGCAMGSPVSATVANLVTWRRVQSQQPLVRHYGGSGTWTIATHVYRRSMYKNSTTTSWTL